MQTVTTINLTYAIVIICITYFAVHFIQRINERLKINLQLKQTEEAIASEQVKMLIYKAKIEKITLERKNKEKQDDKLHTEAR